jgi:hypothetical protein
MERKRLHPKPKKVPEPKPKGRPRHEVTDATRQQVSLMSALNLNQTQISAILGIDDETLRKYYRDELDTGLAKAVANVGAKLYKTAVSDKPNSLQAQMFFLKARAGWAEKHELTGANGGAIQIEASRKVDLASLPPEQLTQFEAMLRALPKPSEDK